MKAWRCAAPVLVFAFATAEGCGSGSSNSGFGGTDNTPTGDFANGSSSGSSGSAGGGAEFAGDGGLVALPREMHLEDQFKAPVATGNFVWSANPMSGRVAYINASSFDVETTPAGDGPTYLAAVPDPSQDVAIVLNVLSQDATLLKVDSQGKLETQTYPSTSEANSWAISPTGHWAIAWTNVAFVTNPDPTQSFQSIAVMDLTAKAPDAVTPAPSTLLAVGYRPTEIAFAADESRAFVVSQDGISTLQLAGVAAPTVTRLDGYAAPVAAPSDAGGAATDDGGDAGDASSVVAPVADAGASTTPSVAFTSDGSYGLIRSDGVPWITVDRMQDGTLTTVPLPSPPTDLSLSPRGDFAVAVLRDTSTVAVLPIPGVFTDPTSIETIAVPGHTIGRGIVTADGDSVVLFTTTGVEESLTVLTLKPSLSERTIPLHAAVEAVFPSNDGQYAVVLNQLPAGSSGATQGAFSVVPIAQSLPAVIESLPAPPNAVAVSNDRAIVSTRNDTSQTYGLYLVLMPSLNIRTYPLASPPIAVGIAQGASRGYAAQDFSEGRITFVDLAEGPDAGSPATRTITGFELSAGILVGPDR